MFEWLKLKKPRRCRQPLYLGDLAVVPRSDIRRFFEFDWKGDETDISLKQWMSETLELPLVNERAYSTDNFLVIDVLLGEYRIGGSGFLDINPYSFLLLWRPYAKLHFRLRDGKTDRLLGNYLVTRKMQWGE